jgi:hypothetical protein
VHFATLENPDEIASALFGFLPRHTLIP